MAVNPRLRLAEAIKVSSKSRENICKAVGIHLNTLGTYINGKRPISLELAHKIMLHLRLDPESLFSSHPIRRNLTGVIPIDRCIRKIVTAMNHPVDVAVEYFAPEYLCVSSDYAYHERANETAEYGTNYYDVELTKHEKSFGVDRATEHQSFQLRKKNGWSCTPQVVFADIISRHCVALFIRNTWKFDETEWNNSTIYESFDHLFFTERIGEIAYGEKEPLVKRKVWTPMPNFEDTRWYSD